ncbi:uncharacterized protein LOC130936793 [Arachis stenosperma]|uniref:uncharacterized protein LOC130936793 n=1 Tax=Arachis stenosperma TaxID=217475 RepID=UPI0025AC5370|nr:uncharacterized protein LOC130936793 [Arachis stenosperma]XP_057722925.1 uncharacterized protein LOC130936793 [Arachis stenosperma]
MAKLNDPQEPATFPSKRKPDDPIPQEPLIKTPKLSTFDCNNNSINHLTDSEPLAEKEKSETDVVLDKEAGNGDTKLRNDVVDNDKEHVVDEEEYDDDDDEDDEDDNVEAEVDRKGKGVLRDDKGKGKLIVEEEDDDDDDDDDDSDDDSDVDGISGDDSDFSDDPLAEVDLNNILPSRTRRRTFQPGLHIPSKPVDFTAAADDDDDDDSDA